MSRFPDLARAAFDARSLRTIASGGIAGLCLVAAICPWRLLLGNGHAEDTALLFIAALCWWLPRVGAAGPRLAAQFRPFALLTAAVWTLLIPFVVLSLLQGLKGMTLITLETPLVHYATVFAISLLALPPVFLGIGLAYQQQRANDVRATWHWPIAFGLSCVFASTCLLPFFGARVIGWTGLICGAALLVAERWALSAERFAPDSEETLVGMRLRPEWTGSLLAILTGGALAVACYVASQLIPRNLTNDLALVAGVLLSCSLAMLIRHGRTREPRAYSSSLSLLFLAAWISTIAAGYPLWVWCCLQMNAWVSSLPLLLLLRTLLLMAFVLPAGLIIRRLAGPTLDLGMPASHPIKMALGFSIFPWLTWSPSSAAMLTAGAALTFAFVAWAKEGFPIPHRTWQRWSTAGLACTAVLGLWFGQNLNPRYAEKILFSSHTLQSLRQGIDADQLPWIDEGRQVAAFDSANDHYSLSRYRGSQMVVRHNGLSTGMISTDPGSCPHSAADVLPMLLPLAFHPDAENVLLLGIHPAALLTCQEYPLRVVRTLDGSAASHQLLNWLEQNVAGWNLTGGPEFQFGRIDPLLALYSSHNCEYDLIVCPLTQPADAAAASYTAQEFYQQVFARLSANGMFAQRIPYYDLGPDVIQSITATMQSVFPEVEIVETVPGELVFLCARDHLPRIDEALVERLKSPQCRKLLGQAGWDWSMVLGRGGLTSDAVATYTADSRKLNTAANGRFAASLSQEVSRWGNKANATREALARHGEALRAGLKEESVAQEVTHRLEDLSLAHRMQQDHPNDPWGYRAALKERLKERPRSQLVHVKHEGLKRMLDPEDRVRKEYLQSLGDAARQPHPPLEAIVRLTAYEEPFDPLVSLFVHHEAIQLMERCETPDVALQYRNLLHTIYFANSQDQSVRNVSSALNLVCDNAAVTTSPAAQWDHVNSLMQVLAQRWQLRLQAGKPSKYDAVDAEQSSLAVAKAVDLLSKHYADAGMTADEWKLRHMSLEQSLLRPLRQHRSVQLRQVPVTPLAAAPATTEPAAATK
ncbi:polyamine aminopropyltransferase [Planctomicrobium piriforme]|uniref:Spermidine synthase n=1 Tax=Planctomicrobium piriforme TaxID=1576369 RepID=A0A1I3HCH0_9PLAN|nr:hypothetical protein [Planctomicrobium piriforme]SFI33329.1 hypothetical protein SAMN05421753_1082 [Planctomicrobium piriforme]